MLNDDGNLDVTFDSNDDIYGFQFFVSTVSVTGAGGGAAALGQQGECGHAGTAPGRLAPETWQRVGEGQDGPEGPAIAKYFSPTSWIFPLDATGVTVRRPVRPLVAGGAGTNRHLAAILHAF